MLYFDFFLHFFVKKVPTQELASRVGKQTIYLVSGLFPGFSLDALDFGRERVGFALRGRILPLRALLARLGLLPRLRGGLSDALLARLLGLGRTLRPGRGDRKSVV